MVKVGIIGASGFTGAELLRLAAQHPDYEVVLATGDTQAGVGVSELYPGLAAAYPSLTFEAFDLERAAGLDLVFLGLPHEASMAMAPSLVGSVGCVVDLSAAYRLKDASQYPVFYGFEHDQPGLLADAVYGLPELHRSELEGASLIATPGCYVTAATLALRPLVEAGVIATSGVIVDAASGVTGAGRKADYAHSFTTVDENFTAYGLLSHRHTPEMEQEIGAQLLFTPHLAPINRGISPRATPSRPPARRCRPRPDCSICSASAGATNRSSSSPMARHRPSRRSDRTRSTSQLDSIRAPRRCWRSPPSTTSPKAQAAGRSRPRTSPSGSTRPPASPRSAWRHDDR
jgi:N-acetyl-gamma-glutamyl-phosphate reductase